MCLRTVFWLSFGCLLLVGVACKADEHAEKVEREDADSSESYGQLFNFLSNMFGGDMSQDNKTDAANKLNASSIEALKEFLSNITQSVKSDADNVSESNEQSQPTDDTSQQTNADGIMGLNATMTVNSTVPNSQSTDGTLPETNTDGTTGVNAAIAVNTVIPNSQSNDETSSQTNAEGVPVVNTTSTLVTSTIMTTPSTWATTTVTFSPPEDDICYTDSILQDFCSVSNDMTDVSFWDIYSLMFSDKVLSALQMRCPKGSWCLQDRFDYWNSLIDGRVDMVTASQISTGMCAQNLQRCIVRISDNYVNCSTYLPILFTAEALPLICDLKRKNMTETCYKHVVTALHVTLADIMRDNEDYDDEDYDNEDYDDNYDQDRESRDTCSTPEADMTKALMCVTNSCPGEADAFHNFKPWGWFTSVVDDLIVECNFDPDKCLALIQPPSAAAYRMVSMLAVSGAMAALMFTVITTWICYKRYRHNTVIKDGYQKLLNDGDES